LKYHLYRNSFPLYAAARFRNQAQEAQQYCALTFEPGEFRLRSRFFSDRMTTLSLAPPASSGAT